MAVSADADTIAGIESRRAGCCTGVAVVGSTPGVDEAVDAALPAESTGVVVVRAGLGAGNSSCDRAMTISERNNARKKRLSIQGTGS